MYQDLRHRRYGQPDKGIYERGLSARNPILIAAGGYVLKAAKHNENEPQGARYVAQEAYDVPNRTANLRLALDASVSFAAINAADLAEPRTSLALGRRARILDLPRAAASSISSFFGAVHFFVGALAWSNTGGRVRGTRHV
jgi:hypothetical protein